MAPTTTDEKPAWSLVDHICRVCFGRVLEGPAGAGWEAGAHRYRCSNCALEAIARHATCICCCGEKIKGHGRNAERDAGVRCTRNPDPTPEFPSEIVAGQLEAARGQ